MVVSHRGIRRLVEGGSKCSAITQFGYCALTSAAAFLEVIDYLALLVPPKPVSFLLEIGRFILSRIESQGADSTQEITSR